MGCGVLFPRDFECKSDSEGEGELIARVVEDRAGDQVNIEAEEYETDSGDEDEWWRPEAKIGDKVQVREFIMKILQDPCDVVISQVYFTRNGKIIGKKDVVLPRGGFYPTVGMMSSQVKESFMSFF